MAFESFYGGRPGASTNIVYTYNSYQEMVEDFRKGGDSTDKVNYGENVVINNIDDVDYHGNVYKRGMNYGLPDGGAIFIGRMCGPRGEIGGIHILGKVNSASDLNNETPPESIAPADPKHAGQVMAVGADGTIPDIYAYNYFTQQWFYAGSMPYSMYTISRYTVDYDGAD